MLICLDALLSSTVRAIQHMCMCAQHVWMHVYIHTWKSEQLTWDYYTAEKVVWFHTLKACVRITGCWHQSPGLVVVDEGVSLNGAWHGRDGGREEGRREPSRTGGTMWLLPQRLAQSGQFTSGCCHTQWCEAAYASNRGKGERRKTKCTVNIFRKGLMTDKCAKQRQLKSFLWISKYLY